MQFLYKFSQLHKKMTLNPFHIIQEINKKKDNHENYYFLVDKLLISSKQQTNDIKYQIYYIVAKEFFYFKEHNKSEEYFLLVLNNRDLFVVHNLLEDTILHLLILKTSSTKEVAEALYNIFIIKNEKFLQNIELDLRDIDCDVTFFFTFLYENNEYDYAVYFLTSETLEIFIDKLMVQKYYTKEIKDKLLYFNNIYVFLYLSVFDKKNIRDYSLKIKSFKNNTCKDLFYMKHDISQDFIEKVQDENTIFFLYKNRKYLKLINCISVYDNFAYNILYFSYFKLENLVEAEKYYKNVEKILFSVDEIEYLIFLDCVSSVINKISDLDNPTDFIASLEVLYKSKKYEILKECIENNIYKFKSISVFKVLISYLLLNYYENIDVCIYIQNYIEQIDFISISDRDWLYKIVYNSIIDDIKYKVRYIDLLYQLKDICLDTIYISLLTNKKDTITLYNEFLESDLEDANSDLYFIILALFYKSNEDKNVFMKLDITQRSNDQIKDFLEIITNKDLIIEAHMRNILSPEILERAILEHSLKGKLYPFLVNIFLINIKKYLSYNSKIIINKEIEIYKIYGDYRVVEFFLGII